MAIWHGESGKKPTGGKIHLNRKKRKFELGRFSINPRVGEDRRTRVPIKGGKVKTKLVSIAFVNVLDPKNKTMKKTKIMDVITNPANPDLARRKVITRGAVVNTELGKVKVTSRPSQHGVANGILIQE